MNVSEIIFFFIIFIYVASIFAVFTKKNANEFFKKALRIINWIALIFTVAFIILWFCGIHLSELEIEIVPFWTFLISAIMLFGLTKLRKGERIFYGVFFFGHLFLTVILIIPFVGIGITTMVYAPFLTDSILYEDTRLMVTDETSGFLSPKPSPTIYLKDGLFSRKYNTAVHPVYAVDSISLVNDNGNVHVIIYEDTNSVNINIKK
jgi:hypothetical protein